jgi:transcriptional regulator with XRE-family HTH domain
MATDPEVTPEQLAEQRERMGMNQARLAELLGVTKDALNRWERGRQKIGNPQMLYWALRGLATRKWRKG